MLAIHNRSSIDAYVRKPEKGGPWIFFIGRGVKFDERGTITGDNVGRNPRFCRFYQMFGFDLLDDIETAVWGARA